MAHILIVEDEDALRRIITLNLVRRGFSVIEDDSVATADEAIAATPQPFDLILLDINLPDQTGWDVLRHLQATSPTAAARQPHVIVLTDVRLAQSRIEEFQAVRSTYVARKGVVHHDGRCTLLSGGIDRDVHWADRVRLCLRSARAPSDALTDRRTDEGNGMGLEYIVTGIIALLVGMCLMIALLRPNTFRGVSNRISCAPVL